MQKNNKISLYERKVLAENIVVPNEEKLVYDNGFGGFKNNGKEYVIYNKNTPTPWSNVIANKNFGTIITNNGCGYTFAYNSGEFKITSWSNDIVVNDKSEGFKINGKVFDPEKCTHGFGYSVLEAESEDLRKEVTEFVAAVDSLGTPVNPERASYFRCRIEVACIHVKHVSGTGLACCAGVSEIHPRAGWI